MSRARGRIFPFDGELLQYHQLDTPGKMVFRWNNDIGCHTLNDEQHPIAQRIGPELQPFVTGLSSDVPFFRNGGTPTNNEV